MIRDALTACESLLADGDYGEDVQWREARNKARAALAALDQMDVEGLAPEFARLRNHDRRQGAILAIDYEVARVCLAREQEAREQERAAFLGLIEDNKPRVAQEGYNAGGQLITDRLSEDVRARSQDAKGAKA